MRRSANSEAERCSRGGSGRRRNRSNVPALMWREAFSTWLMSRSASPKATPLRPKRSATSTPDQPPSESTCVKIASDHGEVEARDQRLAEEEQEERGAVLPVGADPGADQAPPHPQVAIDAQPPCTTTRRTARRQHEPPEPPPARRARPAGARAPASRSMPVCCPSQTSIGTWSIDANGRTRHRRLEPPGKNTIGMKAPHRKWAASIPSWFGPRTSSEPERAELEQVPPPERRPRRRAPRLTRNAARSRDRRAAAGRTRGRPTRNGGMPRKSEVEAGLAVLDRRPPGLVVVRALQVDDDVAGGDAIGDLGGR